LLGNGSKPLREVFQIELESSEIPFDAGKIETLFASLVLLEMKDVATVPVDEIRNGRIQALAIRAPQQENSALLHVRTPASAVILLKFFSTSFQLG
jgi:hypothetical protein